MNYKGIRKRKTIRIPIDIWERMSKVIDGFSSDEDKTMNQFVVRAITHYLREHYKDLS